MDDLAGKTAVVTGAASGMGLAFADRFARAGMNVVLADIEEPALDAAVARVADHGITAVGHLTDVSDAGSMDALAARAVDEFGAVNVVCNNAGVAGSLGTLRDMRPDEWAWVLGVNLWGVIHGHRVFLPHLLEHGDGHIVNTSSMAGHFPGHSAYTASKWAVVGITEGLYHSLNEMKSTVGVSCLCPGWVDTRILDSDRNRPEWAAPSALDEDDGTRQAQREYIADALRGGMPPAEVADLVHDAVVNRKFWIFTDLSMVDRLADRHQAVLQNQNPPVWEGLA